MENFRMEDLHAISDPSEAQSEQSLAHRRTDKRGRILREVVDLFLERPAVYTDVQRELFERVMAKLIDQVDEEVRAHLSEKLAPGEYTPSSVAQRLAGDAAISVAGPMLARSPVLDDDFLVESAKTRSQQHLLAISSRASVGTRVTDVLVDRGDRMVVMTLAANDGAKFSEAGHSALVERARDDQQLALAVLCRPDISRPQMLALVERASAVVRQQLIAEGALKVQEIADVVREASRRLRTGSQITSDGYVRARERVGELQRTSGLSETVLLGFIHEARFEEVVVTLSEMSGLAATDLERMLVEMAHDRLMIVARALGLSWNVVSELVVMNQPQRKTPEAMERLRLRYLSIPPQTATRTLRFHQLRTRAQDGAA
jgi:uncharacterized protein (DUF2336 family)